MSRHSRRWARRIIRQLRDREARLRRNSPSPNPPPAQQTSNFEATPS